MRVSLITGMAFVLLGFGSDCRASARTYGADAGDGTTVRAILNRIPLSSGDRWALDLDGDNLVNYALDDAAAAALALDDKMIVELTLAEARDVATRALNITGIGNAMEAHADGNDIVLGAPPEAAGTTPGEVTIQSRQWHHPDQMFEPIASRRTIHPRMKAAQLAAPRKKTAVVISTIANPSK